MDGPRTTAICGMPMAETGGPGWQSLRPPLTRSRPGTSGRRRRSRPGRSGQLVRDLAHAGPLQADRRDGAAFQGRIAGGDQEALAGHDAHADDGRRRGRTWPSSSCMPRPARVLNSRKGEPRSSRRATRSRGTAAHASRNSAGAVGQPSRTWASRARHLVQALRHAVDVGLEGTWCEGQIAGQASW